MARASFATAAWTCRSSVRCVRLFVQAQNVPFASKSEASMSLTRGNCSSAKTSITHISIAGLIRCEFV
ncbi:hypothetical protein PLICRDRAFT_54804 [Plicaturopsis crispa FD-325 SS-3]|nr:hypothetical protein PLICRDRAFT_54804 [Plicaturopsis crispa FD-325 SS-3]